MLELDLDDAANLIATESPEDDYFVEAIDELRPKMTAQRRHRRSLHVLVLLIVGEIASLFDRHDFMGADP